MRSIRAAVPIALAAGGVASGVGLAAHGRDWQQSISVPIVAEYDSNPLFLGDAARGISRGKIIPAYDLTATRGVDEFRARLGLSVERSSDERISDDREDPSLLLGWQRTTTKGAYGLVAKYDQASSRFSELEESGVRLLADGTRTTQSIAGNWSAALDERNTLSADAEYRDVSYDRGRLTDYESGSAGLAYRYAWSELVEPGKTTWTNIVCACTECNKLKGGRTPEEARMKLIRKPAKPKHSPMLSLKLRSDR